MDIRFRFELYVVVTGILKAIDMFAEGFALTLPGVVIMGILYLVRIYILLEHVWHIFFKKGRLFDENTIQ